MGDSVVSVGLPVYNGERYLRGALDALIAQTYTGIEIIVSDNCSQDATESICHEYAARDPRIRYVRQRQNLGGLWNFGFVLEQARGEYFMWAAVDDLWSENFIDVLRCALDANPGAVAAQGEYVAIDAHGAALDAVTANTELAAPGALRRLLTLARQRTTNIYVYGLYRTRTLRAVGVRPLPFTRGYAQAAEYPLLYCAAAAGPTLTDRRARFCYRRHPGQESNRKHSLAVATLLRLGLMVALPRAVWKGSRSAGVTAIATLAIWFYQTRSMTWKLLRAAVGR